MPGPPAPEPSATPPTVDVLDPVGRKGTIPATQLAAAQAQGFTVAAKTPEDNVYEDAISKGFSPIVAKGISAASPFLSVQQGTVGGATAGLGEGLQRKIAGVVGPIAAKALGGPELSAEQAEEYYKFIAQGGAHPNLHTGGEVAGMVGSAVAAPYLRGVGAAGTVGKGLGALTSLGEGAAAGAKALTGGLAARGALGRAAATGIDLGVRGAIETGVYSGVHELSEEMFGKPELSAEKILSAASDGAYNGGILGGAIGVGGSLAASGVRGARTYAGAVTSKNADALTKIANEQRWRAINPRQKFSQKADLIPGGRDGVGETLGEYVFKDKSILEAIKSGDVATTQSKVNDALQSVGQRIGETRAASNAMVSWGAIDDAIEKVASPLKRSALLSDDLAKVEQLRSELATDFLQNNETAQAVARGEISAAEGRALMREQQIPLKDVVDRRQILDKKYYDEIKALDPKGRVELMRDARANLEDTIMSAFDDAAKAEGNVGARAELDKLKLDYRRLALARDAMKVSAPAAQANRAIGLTDYVTASAFGGGLKGLAAGAANKFFRERGNAIAAATADKLAGLGRKVTKAAPEAAVEAERLTSFGPGKIRRAEEAVAGEPPVPSGPPAELLAKREALAGEAADLEGKAGQPFRARPGEPTFGEPPVRPDVGPEPVRPPVEPEPALPVDEPLPAAAATGTFEERLTDAIHEINKRGKHDGLVPVYKLRAEFPELSKAEFDAKIIALDKTSNDFRFPVADSTNKADRHISGQRPDVVEEIGRTLDGAVVRPRQATKNNPGETATLGHAVAYNKPSGKPWARSGTSGGSFEERINDAIHEANKRGPRGTYHGLVPMREIRAEFPELSKAEFNEVLAKAEDKNLVDLKTIDNIKYASTEDAEAAIVKTRAGDPSKDIFANAKTYYGFGVANKDASGKVWQRAVSEKEHAARKVAAEDKYADDYGAWFDRDEAATVAHEKAMSDWKASRSAADESHAQATSSYEAAKAEAVEQHKAALAAYEAEQAADAAYAAERAAQFDRVQKAIEHVDSEIHKAAKGVVSEPKMPASSSSQRASSPYRSQPKNAARDLVKRFDKARADVETMQQNAIKVSQPTGLDDMPNISTAMQLATMRTAEYISAQVPATLGTPSLGEDLPEVVSDADMHDFLEKFDAAQNPMSVVRNFANGRVTMNQVEALKAVSPEMFFEIQQAALEQVRNRQAEKKPVSFNTRQRLATLLEIRTDPSQDPAMAKMLQDNLIRDNAQAAGAGKSKSGGRGMKKMSLPPALAMTKHDKLELGRGTR